LNVLIDFKIDILCITETWFVEGVNYCIPVGFALIRQDRECHAGGVAILVKNSITWRRLILEEKSWISPHSLEYVCVTVQYKYEKSFIVCSL